MRKNKITFSPWMGGKIREGEPSLPLSHQRERNFCIPKVIACSINKMEEK
jgi:hypothetical protein